MFESAAGQASRIQQAFPGEIKMTRTSMIIATVLAAFGLGTAVEVRASADKVIFPADYAKGVIYMMMDRPEMKRVQEFVTSQAAIDAAKKGALMPEGTSIVIINYAAQLDAQGNPVKDENGRLIKTNEIVAYNVMQKQAGWGADYPETKRNGEWEYQQFRADRTPNPAVNLNGCFMCHKPQESQDYVYSYDKMKVAAAK
jgi:hypothetical protein